MVCVWSFNAERLHCTLVIAPICCCGTNWTYRVCWLAANAHHIGWATLQCMKHSTRTFKMVWIWINGEVCSIYFTLELSMHVHLNTQVHIIHSVHHAWQHTSMEWGIHMFILVSTACQTVCACVYRCTQLSFNVFHSCTRTVSLLVAGTKGNLPFC